MGLTDCKPTCRLAGGWGDNARDNVEEGGGQGEAGSRESVLVHTVQGKRAFAHLRPNGRGTMGAIVLNRFL